MRGVESGKESAAILIEQNHNKFTATPELSQFLRYK